MQNKVSMFWGVLFLLLVVVGATVLRAEENWARFRGPNGQGVSGAVGLPVEWDADNNIAWQTDIPGEGWSSPIVWGNRIFVTTATEGGKQCHVLALDAEKGDILWNKHVFDQPLAHKHGKNSYATSTPVTDGETVYAVFGVGGIAALDFDGNIRWTKTDMDFYSQHGMGTSPILYGDLLLLAVNPSNREEPKKLGWQQAWDKSYLLALDKTTKEERWRGKRVLSRIAHATPIVIQVEGKDQILSPAGDVIQGFDPTDGTLIWTVTSSGEPCVPSPVIGEGLVYSSPAGSASIRAVRLGGQGNCTETHIAWEQPRNSPMISSFLYVKPCLYTATDNGSFTCLNATSGDILWQLRLGGALNPSPIYADGKIYVLSEQGLTTVLKPSDNPEEPATILAKNDLEEHTLASIAVSGKRLLIRTDKKLWCIGKYALQHQ